MTRQLEQGREDKTSRQTKAAYRALKGGLHNALERSGYVLVGFSYKDRGYDELLVLKVLKGPDSLVCFVGADSLAGLFVKALRMAEQGKLVFREDKYRS
jgi:hypothetical protein